MFTSQDFVQCSTVMMKMLCENVISNEEYTEVMDKLTTFCNKHNINQDNESVAM